jgi:hypothetical protein
MLICSAIIVCAHVVLAVVAHNEPNFPYATTKFALGLFYTGFSIVFLLCITVASIIFGNEHTNHTLKNSISYGISRGNIYFGKLIVEIIFAFIAFAIITGVDIGSADLLLKDSGPENLELLFKTSFVALPQLLFALAATNCFLFIIESNGAAIAAIIGLTVVFPTASQYLGMKFDFFAKLYEISPWNIVNNIAFEKASLVLPWAGKAGYTNSWLFGMIQMTLIILIGFVVFRRKEVK